MSNMIRLAKESIDKMLQDACASAAAEGIVPDRWLQFLRVSHH